MVSLEVVKFFHPAQIIIFAFVFRLQGPATSQSQVPPPSSSPFGMGMSGPQSQGSQPQQQQQQFPPTSLSTPARAPSESPQPHGPGTSIASLLTTQLPDVCLSFPFILLWVRDQNMKTKFLSACISPSLVSPEVVFVHQ